MSECEGTADEWRGLEGERPSEKGGLGGVRDLAPLPVAGPRGWGCLKKGVLQCQWLGPERAEA